MRLLVANCLDPAANAALETSIYRDDAADAEPALLFYRNTRSVHCGRNQLPAAECAVSWCAEQGIPVFKRISGGGTVFHDPGNQNYAFVVPRRLYDPARFIGLAAAALERIGLSGVSLCQRFSLWHQGRKVGGSAFALSSRRALLHGCIPFATDLELMHSALTPECEPPPGAVCLRSVPAQVANVAPLLPGAPGPDQAMARFREALRDLSCAMLAPSP